MPTTRLPLPTARGHLDALADFPHNPRACALVCHLHPGFGGNMHNNTTYRIAKAWRSAQVAALRFNFLSVHAKHANPDTLGDEALLDAQDAARFLLQQHPGCPLFASGFSFGARTALSMALREPLVSCVLAVGVGVDFFDMRFVAQLRKPVAFVHAEHDEFGALPHLQRLAHRMHAPHKLFVVPGASHLFLGHMPSLEAQLSLAVAWLLETSSL